jgi:quercetin dioxygenase-like cupin family protein
MICRNETVEPTPLFEGATRKLLARGGSLMLVEVRFKAGTVVAEHVHVHEQISYVVKGKVELSKGGRKEILNPGDSFYAGPNEAHGVRFIEDSVIVDGFTPQREDFLGKA